MALHNLSVRQFSTKNIIYENFVDIFNPKF